MSETSRAGRVLRSIGAIVVGLIAVIVLSIGTDIAMHASGVFPPMGEAMSDSLFVLSTAYRVVFGIAGSYIAARLAADQPMKHALAVGAVGFVLSIAGAAATWNAGEAFGPRWYPLALVVTALPCAWLGGWLRMKQLRGAGVR